MAPCGAAMRRTPIRSLWPLPAALSAGLLYLLVVCAWQADDAFITWRTVANAWAGHGLVWNPGIRVQTYTHPLWMAVGWLCYGVFGEMYFSVLAVSGLLALATAALLVRLADGDAWLACAALLAIAASAAFVDFSVSGLENPLLGLGVVAFAAAAPGARSARGLAALALIAAAVGLTRLDALLLVAPALAHAAWRVRPRAGAVAALAAGFAPLVAWEGFALVYYGSPVPNSAWAKLNVAIGLPALAARGADYLLDSLTRDPITEVATLACVAFACVRGNGARRAAAAGVVLYLVYVVCIGGDFMSGRFLTAPLLLGVATALGVAREAGRSRRSRRSDWLPAAACAALAVYGFAWPGSRWLSGRSFGNPPGFASPAAITDERAYYYPTTGLLRVLAERARLVAAGLPVPPYEGAILGARFARRDEPVALQKAVGYFGYFAGPHKTVVDVWAICDPLLARIPFRPAGDDWRVGHFERPVPAGYLESLRSGQNRIRDPRLAEVYEALDRVTRGPLWDAQRWRAIWRLHTGFYRAALERAAAR